MNTDSEDPRADPPSEERIETVVYEHLRAIARHQMSVERPEHTLIATALDHEAYLRLKLGFGDGARRRADKGGRAAQGVRFYDSFASTFGGHAPRICRNATILPR